MLQGVVHAGTRWACTALTGLLVCSLCLSGCSAEQPAGKAVVRNPESGGGAKVALVVGNKDYQQAPLQNPVNDAEAISTVLSRLGFSVTTRTNLDQQQFVEAIEGFTRKIGDAEAALFYFSGHGCQVNGENYLVPLGYDFQSDADLKYKAVHAGHVLGKMEDAKSRVNIMILDECRNNPFKGFRDQSRGVAALQGPKGAFIAYATAPHSVASDTASERNSVYTKRLVRALETQGLSIDQAFTMVANGVHTDTSGRQVPWKSSSLVSPFSFHRPIDPVGPGPTPEPPEPDTVKPPGPPQPVRPRDPLKDEAMIRAAWKSDADEIERLLYLGADVNAKDDKGWPALIIMAGNHRNSLEAMKLLLDRGADVNAKDEVGQTALHITAGRSDDRVETVQLLLDRGADIIRDNDGRTPLYVAKKEGNTKIATILTTYRGGATKK